MTAAAECAYCRETKPASEFNREHVVPESFGKFVENFVLHGRVCQSCNSYFAHELELTLGRDSMEGLERFRSGIAPRKKRRHIVNELVRATYQGGPYDGAALEFSECPSTGRLVLNPVPQLGFSASQTRPVEWLDGTIPIRLQGTINATIQRAMAKIAFNYLIYHYPAIALMEQFDPIRRYVRYGLKPGFEPVAISQDSILGGVTEDQQVLVHTVTASWQHASQQVLGQVSLFSWMQYRVTLAAEPFLVPPVCIDSGHVFDPFSRQILLLSRWIDSRKRPRLPLREKEAG
jgi:hypothetical protein